MRSQQRLPCGLLAFPALPQALPGVDAREPLTLAPASSRVPTR